VYAVIAGKDEKDMTSLAGGYTYARPNGALPAGFKVAYPQEYLAHIKHEGVRAACDDAAARLTAAGAAVKSVSMPLLGYAIPTYYILMCAEATSNLARYDGVKYGKRHPDAKDLVEVYEKSRTAYLGNEVKRRLMLGNYALSSGYFDAYYMKAQRVRTLIRQEILAVLQEFDVILTPTAPTPAPVFNAESDPLEVYLSDIFTVPANLSGCAALNVPYREREKLPVGVQLMAAPAAEQTLFDAAAAIVNQRGVRV
jgi:aspartyl-tRNA(Asn)/glutamyl-tRNA(Gln) amidotransferase subunit A